MKKSLLIKISFPLSLLTLLIPHILLHTGCATIVPPEGGPRDTLPPVLVKADPGDSSLNFSGRTITFSFNEYVDADNYQQEMIVSPIPENMPAVNRKLRTVTVKLRDTLEPNTTYSLNFGNTIKDVNEGNVLKNFTYIFSTGSYFDSLEFRGNVVLAETGGIDSTLTIMLHKTNVDSALIREKPRYVTKLDSTGHFHFKNLPQDTFYVYALQDAGGGYRYLNTEMLFAFADSAVAVTRNTKPVTLYAYSVKEAEKPVSTTSTTTGRGKDKRLKFSTSLTADQQDLLGNLVFTFETKLKTFDSTKVRFTRDSTFLPVTGYRWEMDSTRKKLTFHYPWQENVQHHIIVEKDFAIDTLGQQLLKADTLSFRTKETRDYGKLTLRFRNLDLSKNPVLLFVQNDQVVSSYPLQSTTFSQALFAPGEYSLRLLSDSNKNGKWDPGSFFKTRKQPELVKPISRVINVRAGMDNVIDVDVTATSQNGSRPQGNRPQQPGRTINNRQLNRF